MNAARLLQTVLVLLLAFCVVAGVFALLDRQRELERFRERESELGARAEDLQARLEHERAYLHKLLDDPDFLARVIRDKLGYVREDEVILQFGPSGTD